MGTQQQVREHTERAVAALARGALEDAATEFGHAIYLSPRDVVLRQRLGDLLARLGRIPAAVRQFQHVAGHYAAEGQLLKAIAICRVILEMEPGHAETQATLAELFALQHEPLPLGPRLPATMSGAAGRTAAPDPDLAVTQESAPLDLRVRDLFLEPPATALAAPAGPDAPTEADITEPMPLDFAAIGRAPLFSMLERDAFLAVIQRLDLHWVKAGDVIVEEGDAGDTMFIVVQGVMNVLRGKAAEGGKPIAVLGEGSFFGEMALVAGSPRLATVVAGKDGLLFSVSRAALEELEAKHPAIRKVIEEFFRERLLANLLAVSPLFRAFGPEQKQRLAARFQLSSLPAGATILEQGRPGGGLFVLLRGRCEVFHTTRDAQQLPYPPMKEGDVFGEISLLFGSPCTATVRAASHCEVLELPQKDFAELVLPHPSVKTVIDELARERLGRTADLLLTTDEVQDSWLV